VSAIRSPLNAAFDKIFAGRDRRAVPLRQLSIICMHVILTAARVVINREVLVGQQMQLICWPVMVAGIP